MPLRARPAAGWAGWRTSGFGLREFLGEYQRGHGPGVGLQGADRDRPEAARLLARRGHGDDRVAVQHGHRGDVTLDPAGVPDLDADIGLLAQPRQRADRGLGQRRVLRRLDQQRLRRGEGVQRVLGGAPLPLAAANGWYDSALIVSTRKFGLLSIVKLHSLDVADSVGCTVLAGPGRYWRSVAAGSTLQVSGTDLNSPLSSEVTYGSLGEL